jgi:hypothetical protein
MLTDQQLIAKYGQPGDLKNIVTITLPFTLQYVVSATKSVPVNKMQCHKLVAPKLIAVYKEILAVYGIAEIKRLWIDKYGGCLNVRLMRGSKNRWSRHSWGVAVDHDPLRNLLHETRKTARFARPEYKPMLDIWYKHGFLNLGVEKNYDWMHFEVAS